MKLVDLVKLAGVGFTRGLPEICLLDFVDAQGKPNNESGDTLALFIVRELNDTFDAEASEEQQIETAIIALTRARRDLENVMDAIEAGVGPEEELLIHYQCPECGDRWDETCICICDSECPKCRTEYITALSWERVDKQVDNEGHRST